ncbi:MULTISPECIES: C40 family peptidase [Rhodococcus]|uniref:C40 family peptidase n=1 Tax=Rhodococcus TaxID=1827 RepID=UPI0004A973FD|nr:MULTISPECIES: C40 family peptidase [Rhodococcus]KDQ02393.1 hydrolase [Rhodococcus qingshengii]KPH17666.1 hydrolase [Rhodococcus sp. ADH]MBT9295452.1 C40 family peptidase [Rhodococcus sp. GOMB7]
MIDVDALARPIIDLVDTVGTGVPSTNGPDVGIRIATDALEIAYQLGSAALSELASSQSSSTALTAAVTKTEQTQTSTRNLADRGTDIAGVVDEATTSVYAGMTELGEILQSFLTLAIKAGPTLMTPTGQLMLLSAALEHLGRAVSVIERVRGELAGSTDKMSALVPSVPIPDPAPGVSESAGGSGSASGSGSVGGSGSASGSGSVGGVEVELPDGSIATAPNAEAAAAVRNALTQQGVPYAWGGTTPGVGLDCSGLTQWAYGQAGVDIPRLAQEQGIGNQVDQNNLMPGDLAVWDGHVAMVIGGGQMIEAGDPVEISAIRTTNSGMGFHGFYRPTE